MIFITSLLVYSFHNSNYYISGHIIWISLGIVAFLLFFYTFNRLLILFGQYIYLGLSPCTWVSDISAALSLETLSIILLTCRQTYYIYWAHVNILQACDSRYHQFHTILQPVDSIDFLWPVKNFYYWELDFLEDCYIEALYLEPHHHFVLKIII